MLSAMPHRGGLTLPDNDFSHSAERMFGEEFEYWLNFDEDNTQKLAKALGGDGILEDLSNFSDGQMKNEEFKAFCKKKGIEYSYSSWN